MSGGGGRPTSAHFDTTDPEAAEDFIRAVYVDPRMRLVGGREHFRFVHVTSGAACAGTLGVAVNRIASSTPLELDTAPLDDLLIVTLVRAGRLDYRPGDAGLAAVSARPGSVVLAPTSGGTAVSMAPCDGSFEVETVVLGLAETARHAAVCGTAPASLRFTGLAPVDRAAALRWTRLVAHVRDEVLAVPAVAGNPPAVAGAVATLARAALRTFPNTALAAVLDHARPVVRGRIGAPVLRGAVDHLRDHAALPLPPGAAAEAVGAEPHELETALRRRGTSSVRERWIARLEGARRELAAATVDGTVTVAAVAARWGFVRGDRFTAVYRRHFGESPQHTLGRCR